MPGSLTPDEEVQVEFNLDRIRWWKIDDLIQAFRIAQGHPAPASYYKAIEGDTTKAAASMGSDLLTRMMRGRR
jgi:hypothetical protein